MLKYGRIVYAGLTTVAHRQKEKLSHVCRSGCLRHFAQYSRHKDQRLAEPAVLSGQYRHDSHRPCRRLPAVYRAGLLLQHHRRNRRQHDDILLLHQRAYRVGGGVLCADGLADEVPEDARRHTDLFRYRRNRRRCAYVVPLRSQLGRGCRGYARAEHHQLYGHEPLFGGLGGELPDRYCRQGDIHLCRASALEAPAEKIHRLLRDFRGTNRVPQQDSRPCKAQKALAASEGAFARWHCIYPRGSVGDGRLHSAVPQRDHK